MRRREFFKVGGAGAATLATASVLSASGQNALAADEPNGVPAKIGAKRYRVGLIGTGWYGKVDLFRLMQVATVDVVSVCDVDREALEEAVNLVAERQNGVKPRAFHDYREMLAQKDLDIVLIGTPDHWHALQTIDAIAAGADVYVQKPIGVDVVECQAMLAAARKANAVVQVGLQRRSTPHLMKAKREIVDSGRLGKVGQVDVYSYYGGPGTFKQDPAEIPDGFDFDLWTGPAPKLTYLPCMRRGSWRNFIEFGNGIVGDMGVHMFDMARWLLGVRYPKRIFSSGGIYLKKGGTPNTADTQTIVFEYDDLQIVWNHRTWSEVPDWRHPWGGVFYGEHGILKASVYGYDFKRYNSQEKESVDVDEERGKYPEDATERRIEMHTAPAIRSHMVDFVERIEDRGRPRSDIEEGAISTICCVLGNISAQLGRALEWDEETGKVKNDDEANALLARPYRAPWVHPQV